MKKALFLGILIALFISCKREKVETIGPEIAIASPNFSITNSFAAFTDYIDFTTEQEWFLADFNERVTWKITIKGLQSNAEKVLSGTSRSLNMDNSIWLGGHNGLNFFQGGETAAVELTVFGSQNKWHDTITIAAEREDFGSDAIVWWDMDQIGVARQGVVYWYDFFDTNEKIVGLMDGTFTDAPVQGAYRSMEGKDGLGPSNYYIGAASHGALGTPTGFNAPLNQVYLNFYVRRRTPTTSLGVSLTSDVGGGNTSELSYNVGEITTDGWRLVSINLASMTLKAGNLPFDPANITTFLTNLQIVSLPGVDQPGFDIDFIVLTKGAPFDPSKF